MDSRTGGGTVNQYMTYLLELIPEKDSLKLVRTEAEKYYKTHTLGECYNMGIELYKSDNFQIQEVGIFLLGYCAHDNEKALVFLKEKVSRHENGRCKKH